MLKRMQKLFLDEAYSNFQLRASTLEGRKAKEDANVVVEAEQLEKEKGRFVGVSNLFAPEGAQRTIPVVAFESRASTLEGIMEALRGPTVTTIGVWGMPGVGKTVLVKEVTRKAKEECLFDNVVVATISHNPNIRKIQDEIANMLDLKFDYESGIGRSIQLRLAFWRRKVLVILEDIWDYVDLEAIGIGVLVEEDENIGTRSSFRKISPVGSKVLLISRSQNVLCQMNCDEVFGIGVLSEEEAMILFTKMLGDSDAIKKPAYRPIVEEVVNQLGGLPLVITVLASVLKNKELDVWIDTLRQIRKLQSLYDGGKVMYSIIEMGYILLQSEEARSLLHLCSWLASQGSSIYVPYLLRCSLGLDLLDGVNTLKEARKSLNALLDELKDFSLLDEGDNNEHLSMHDVISDFCCFITSRDGGEIVKKEAYLKELLRWGELKNCKAINLIKCSDKLPDTLDCPKLEFLVLWSQEYRGSTVSQNFFKEMKELKVLQLAGMNFSSLPISFLSLTNLQTLFLDDCMLHDMAIIGELKKLKILTLNGSDIEKLPEEIGKLKELRLLDLSNCSKLVVIPEYVIASLTCLEELYMGNSFDRWDVKGNVKLAELLCFSHLKTLVVCIPDAPIQLPRESLFSELERYKIHVGDVWDWSDDDHGCSRTLKLKLTTNSNLDHGIAMLLKKTEDLYMDELKGVSRVLSELDETGFPNLKSVHVQKNSEIQYILGSIGRIAFPVLESLFLHSLINLRKICGEVCAGSFAGLRIIKVEKCHTLENLFSFSLAVQLSELQEIELIDCKSIIEIVTADAEGEQKNIEASYQIGGILHLRSLTLKHLPELRSFSTVARKDSISQPEEINTLFSTEKVVISGLENLRLSSINNIESVWHNQLFRISCSCIQNLTSLNIERCNKLERLLSSSLARSLMNLKYFEITECYSLREIIYKEDPMEEEEEEDIIISFPRLNSLKIKRLGYLIGFCLQNYIILFPSLKLLEIEDCILLESFTDKFGPFSSALFSEKVVFPSLEKMTISGLRNVEMIWHHDNKHFVNSFSKLKEMTVRQCDKLLTIFPSNMYSTFRGLHILTISYCSSVEEVFELPRFYMRENSTVDIELRELWIHSLPTLVYIWREDPQVFYTCRNLRVLNVRDCWNLQNYVFPVSFTRVLPRLKHLSIRECGVREIVSMSRGLEKIITFEFDQVSSLTLWNLPNLQSFYPREHITIWPMLKELRAHHCNKWKIFSGEKGLPELEELSLDLDNIAVTWATQVSGSLFPKIKVLRVHYCHDEYAIFPIAGLEKFYNLEKLEVRSCAFKNLFSYKGDLVEEIHAGSCLQIRTLKLDDLHNLRFIWEHDSQIAHILPNLENLEVFRCASLISLGLSTVSFTKLTTLNVRGCKALINLVSSSAVKSLVHLEQMVVARCQSMKEIVGSEGDEVTYDIIFTKLKCLELKHLPTLTSFSSSNHRFEFPCLEKVIVSQCPELKVFSHGVLDVPMLRRVQLTSKDYKGCWDGDLNNTIQQLYTEKVGVLEVKPYPTSADVELTEETARSTQVEKPLSAIERVPSLTAQNQEIISLDENVEAAHSQKEKDQKVSEMTETVSQSILASSKPSARVTMESIEVIPSAKDNIPVMDEPKAEIFSQTEVAPEIQETGVAAMIEHNVSKIMECMDSDTVRRIALHGVCGVGKTSVLRALANNPKIKREFDLVILVTVSKYWSSKKIQDQIVNKLPAASSSTDPFTILKSKKVLLLLDDVWERIDLQEMGIPYPSKENGSMMILATTELKICHDMEEVRVVKIEPLSMEEAWKLFLEQVPGACDLPDIQHFVQGIVQKCCGLPLFIIVTGRALANENNVLVWEHAFNEFSMLGRDIKSCIEDQIQLLRFSFDRLESPTLKSCFLYCALFSEDQEINADKFVDDCIQERLIAGTWTHSCKRGHDVVDALQHALLLETTTEDGQSIRMRDVIRELAFRILSSESDTEDCKFMLMNYQTPLKLENRSSSSSFTADAHQFLSRIAGRLANEPLTEEEWKQYKMMFLMDNKLSTLPQSPSCPDLLMLFLQRNYQLRVVPDHFFDHMPSLKVLNLSKTRIKFLPKSISKLENLEFLLLRDCERLVKLPSEVGSLQLLQVLDLGGTEIIELAEEIGELASLTHLEVSFYGSSTSSEHPKLPCGLISRLQSLETLSISVYPGDSWWIKNVKSFIEEVSNLKQLNSLSFYLPEVEFLELFLQRSVAWKKRSLREFKFVVGHDVKFNTSRIPKYVELNYGLISGQCLRFVNSEEIPDAILTVLSSCNALHLDHHLGIRRLSEFGIGNVNKLKYCVISECPYLESVVDCTDGTEIEFTSLEHLSIRYSWSLTCIWSVVRQGSFAALKTLSLHACPKLTYVFKTSMLQFLSNLKELQVDDCKAIEEVVSTDEASEATKKLVSTEQVKQSSRVSLKSLRLHYLPNLVHIWEDTETKLLFEYIAIYDCPKLKQIYIDSELKNTLKGIRAEEDWWEESQISSHFEANIFTPIREGDVYSSGDFP